MEMTDPRLLLATLDNLEESLHRVMQDIFGSIHVANQCQQHLREYAERLAQRIERMRTDVQRAQPVSESTCDLSTAANQSSGDDDVDPHAARRDNPSEDRRIAKAVKKWENEVSRAEHRVSAAMLRVGQARSQLRSHTPATSNELSCAESELAAARDDLALCESCFQTALRASDVYLSSAC